MVNALAMTMVGDVYIEVLLPARGAGDYMYRILPPDRRSIRIYMYIIFDCAL